MRDLRRAALANAAAKAAAAPPDSEPSLQDGVQSQPSSRSPSPASTAANSEHPGSGRGGRGKRRASTPNGTPAAAERAENGVEENETPGRRSQRTAKPSVLADASTGDEEDNESPDLPAPKSRKRGRPAGAKAKGKPGRPPKAGPKKRGRPRGTAKAPRSGSDSEADEEEGEEEDEDLDAIIEALQEAEPSPPKRAKRNVQKAPQRQAPAPPPKAGPRPRGRPPSVPLVPLPDEIVLEEDADFDPEAASSEDEEEEEAEERKAEGAGAAAEAAEDEAVRRAALMPQHVVIDRGPSQPALAVPSDAIGDAAAAYTLLRAFSWQLRLSPFSFEDFASALFAGGAPGLLDEVMVCVLRCLAEDENKLFRADRHLDLTLLDTLTWPEYIWEWLRLVGDPQSKHRWLQGAAGTSASIQPHTAAQAAQGQDDLAAAILAGNAKAVSPPAATNDALQVGAGASNGDADAAVANGDAPAAADAAGEAAAVPAGDPDGGTDVGDGAARSEAQPNGAVTASEGAAAGAKEGDKPANGAAGDNAGDPAAGDGAAAAGDAALTDATLAEERGTVYEVAPPSVLRSMLMRQPFAKSTSQAEFYALPPAVKAALMMRLANDLLDVRAVRREVERREGAGQWVAGRGGSGGAFAMRTAQQRAARAAAGASDNDEEGNPGDNGEQGDGNLDYCVLCGLGGSLLCCDGCPGAFHVRCIGESPKSIPDGEWLCAECAAGGRGEAAGLRVPVAGVNAANQPHWACHSALWRSALSHCEGSGCSALETGPVPVERMAGAAAAAALGQLRGRRKWRGEKPHPSTLEALAAPPQPTGRPVPALSYLNRYKNGWAASAAVTKNLQDEARRRRKAGPGGLPASEMPLPIPISRFLWPVGQGRGGSRALLKCGRCQPCLRPEMHKPCLNPVRPAWDSNDNLDASSKLSQLSNYVLKVERELWALLDGPWADDVSLAHRRAWTVAVRDATSPQLLAVAALQLEAALRRSALLPAWDPSISLAPKPAPVKADKPPAAQATPAPSTAPKSALPGSTSQPGSAAVSRSNSAADVREGLRMTSTRTRQVRSYVEYTEDDLSEEEEEAEPVEALTDWSDPKIVLDDPLHNRAGVMVNRRDAWVKADAPERLPRDVARRTARQGGRRRVPGVAYNAKRLALVPRLAWRAAMDAAPTTARLALLLRTLDDHLQWDAINRPRADSSDPFTHARLLSRRPTPDGITFEYLMDINAERNPHSSVRPGPAASTPSSMARFTPAPIATYSYRPSAVAPAGPFVPMTRVIPVPIPPPPRPLPAAAAAAIGPAAAGKPPISPPPAPMPPVAVPTAAAIPAADPRDAAGTPAAAEALSPPAEAPAQAAAPPAAPLQGASTAAADAWTAFQKLPVAGDAAAVTQHQAQPHSSPAGAAASAPTATAKAEQPVVPSNAALASPSQRAPPEPSAAQTTEPQAAAAAHTRAVSQGEPSGNAAAGPAPTPAAASTPLSPTHRRDAATEAADEAQATGVDSTLRQVEAAISAVVSDLTAAVSEAEAGPAARGRKLTADAPSTALTQAPAVSASPPEPAGQPQGAAAAVASHSQPAMAASNAGTSTPRAPPSAATPAQPSSSTPAPSLQPATAAAARTASLPQTTTPLLAQPQAASVPPATSQPQPGFSAATPQPGRPTGLATSVAPAALQAQAGFLAATPQLQAGRLAGLASRPALAMFAAATPVLQRPPVWVHESKLPLWLVKAYEERVRREKAMAAAQAARDIENAAREQARQAAMAAQAANMAARQAAQEALDAARAQQAESRAAAAAAAAAAADACGTCGQLYGDEPDKDHLWIACDRCNKWYHGDCIGTTQEEVDALGDKKKWECPDCLKYRAERKAAAAERARQKRIARGEEPEDEKAAAKKKGRGPDKKPRKRKVHDEEEAQGGDDEAGEELWCICRQPDDHVRPFVECSECTNWFHPECVGTTLEEAEAEEDWKCPFCVRNRKRRQRGAPEAAPPADQPTAAQLAAEPAAEAAPAAEQEPRRFKAKAAGAADGGMGTKKANKLKKKKKKLKAQSESGEAAGEAAVGPGRKKKKKKKGKHVGSKTAADDPLLGTSNAAAAAAAAEPAPQDPVAEKRQKKKRRLEAEEAEPPQAQSPPRHPQGKRRKAAAQQQHQQQQQPPPWQRLALAVLATVAGTSAAVPFMAPVPDAIPGYRRLVAQPMDLGTVTGKLEAGEYASAAGVWRDIQLVWSNCRLFNAEGSEIWEACQRTEQALSVEWRFAGLPTGRADPAAPKARHAPPASAVPSSPAGAPAPLASPRVKLKVKGLKLKKQRSAAAAAAPDPLGVEASPEQLATALKVVRGVMRLKVAELFREPVPGSVKGYHKLISAPMDLGTMAAQLEGGAYRTLGDVWRDAVQVWSNCARFNPEGSEVAVLGQQAQAAFMQRWQEAGLASPTTPAPQVLGLQEEGSSAQQQGGEGMRGRKKKKKDAPADADVTAVAADGAGGQKRKAAAAADPATQAQLTTVLKVVRGLLRMKAAAPFCAPVPAEVAGYYEEVAHPMDLGTIAASLHNGSYTSLAAVARDLELVWSNCRLFNGDGSEIATVAEQVGQALHQRWSEAGLPPLAELVAAQHHPTHKRSKKHKLEAPAAPASPAGNLKKKQKKHLAAVAAQAANAAAAAPSGSNRVGSGDRGGLPGVQPGTAEPSSRRQQLQEASPGVPTERLRRSSSRDAAETGLQGIDGGKKKVAVSRRRFG